MITYKIDEDEEQMIYYIFKGNDLLLTSLIGIIFAFSITFMLLNKYGNKLPKDLGRDFAHEGNLSAGKPRGAGFLFIIAFLISVVIFIQLNKEIIVYLIYITAAMMTGFLDDCSKKPWGEFRKGLLDFIIAFMVSVSYLSFNSSTIRIELFNMNININPILFVVLAIILVWSSINVTNCTDGVDGLSGMLSIVTLITLVIIYYIRGLNSDFICLILIFTMCILGYLWFNVTPSSMIMGDAGSRALGVFISIVILKTGSPFLYIPVAFIIIFDGGLGLIKIFMLRFLKIKILKNIRTPLHDHIRKVWGWSNTQVVYRLAIIQCIISIVVIYLMIIRYN